MRLHLGCGRKKLEGFVGVDDDPACSPDILADLEKPWTWCADGSVSFVVAHHIVEHIRDLVAFMRELYRVLEPGGLVEIIVPHPRSDNYIADPTHVRPILPTTMAMFSRKENQRSIDAGHASSTLAMKYGVDFEVLEARVSVIPQWEHADVQERGWAIAHYCNVAVDIKITIAKVAPQ